MRPKARHRRPLRLPGYDYAQPGAYFVTICTRDRKCLLGQIINGEMLLNETGEIVVEEWLKTAVVRPNIKLDRFVVMPNHFHAILLIAEEHQGTARRAPTREDFGRPVSGSLSTIVRAFKSAVTNRLNVRRNTRGIAVWQRGYYEHVVRDEVSLNRIREYVAYNPLSWELDRENPKRRGEGEFYRWLADFKARPDKMETMKTQ